MVNERLLADNLAAVKEEIAAAAQRGGRNPAEVTLVAVTKYVDADITRALVRAGCRALAENRPQTLWRKAELLQDLPIEWHMVGHVQRNKIRRTLPLVTWIQSVDSPRLLDSLQKESRRLDRRPRILLEVNISRDAEKTGLLPDEAIALAPRLSEWDAFDIRGLMAMSGRLSNRDECRREFSALRMLRDRMQQECPPGVSLSHLSMGMSADYASAVEEGATMVRVGSALFQGLDT